MRTLFYVLLPILLAVLLLCLGCSRDSVSPTAESSVVDTGDDVITDPITGEKGRTTFGNCLSKPVVFAEGYGLTGFEITAATGLRGMPGVESFTDPYDNTTVIDGFPVYQNPSVNEWQADWTTGLLWGSEVPVELDWSDNLVRQTWTDRSKVRVEVILTTLLDPSIIPLEGYAMYSLGGSQLQEIFVTNTTRYQATSANVYSNVARLTIQKLDRQGGVPLHTIYSSACYERYFVDGRTDAYAAEINMGGQCIYGFNWDIGESSLETKSGWYRLTFSLDGSAVYTDETGSPYAYPRNTHITGLHPDDLPGGTDSDAVVYVPQLMPNGYASQLEVYVMPKSPGSRRH